MMCIALFLFKQKTAYEMRISDWSSDVFSSDLTFEKDGITFNLLDTPGHEYFSEDTYRTLTAVDSAVMVIDAARGIEAQTRKLFEVCRLRSVPIITFVNKVDREGRAPSASRHHNAPQGYTASAALGDTIGRS